MVVFCITSSAALPVATCGKKFKIMIILKLRKFETKATQKVLWALFEMFQYKLIKITWQYFIEKNRHIFF